MKVIVTLAAQFEVNVETLDVAVAERTVTGNWDSIYKHTAKWRDGIPPQLVAQVLRVEAEPRLDATHLQYDPRADNVGFSPDTDDDNA